MEIYLHGFDWTTYAEQVMPAFGRWFIQRDESAIHELFMKTRCALEERYLPAPMQKLRTWLRAKDFVDGLPRGPHSRKEYAKLCSAEEFTAFSDRYFHHYAPHLYQNPTALRVMWGAIIEHYCLPWLHNESPALDEAPSIPNDMIEGEQEQTEHREVIALLHDAGLGDIAPTEAQVIAQPTGIAPIDTPPNTSGAPTGITPTEPDPYTGEDGEPIAIPKGIFIGQQPNTLCLRGWLASISVRAMVLFEFLACGRRRMPFGYQAGEPFGSYYGYLTPVETWQLALALRSANPPGQATAEQDYQRFCQQETEQTPHMGELPRLVDEVLPTHAHDFLKAVRRAAVQGLGLICSVE